LTAGIPSIIVDILCNWYSKLYFTVKWNNAFSKQFSVGSGVRETVCPLLFLMFL